MEKSKIIGDCGGTSCDWAVIHKGRIDYYKSKGFNPLIRPTHEWVEEFPDHVKDEIERTDCKFTAYIAGMKTDQLKAELEHELAGHYPDSSLDFQLYSDQWGAARAVWNKGKTLVAILGTGSNAAVFDGENLSQPIPSLGYILGDEGGGSHFGKVLLSAYLYHRLPIDLFNSLVDTYPEIELDYVLKHVYRREAANAWLASFMPFIKRHESHPYIGRMIEEAFDEFIEYRILNIEGYRHMKVFALGGIANIFRDKLKTCFEKYGIDAEIPKKPVIQLLAERELASQTTT